jgi:lipopolysaccharide/colanic/teichoic acid biosynthesis glycosyltransferase
LSPVLIIVSIAILLTMGRPLFFIQERVGLFGRRFRMIKFRTMIKEAEQKRDGLADYNEMTGPVFKITKDPRVTKLGRFLRRSSIDELPQLINVLWGTMSLVGPRPLPVDEQQRILATHRRRLSMRPGITGLWQVSGRSDVDFEQWMELDLHYINEWSLQLDATILVKTVREVILRTGAK